MSQVQTSTQRKTAKLNNLILNCNTDTKSLYRNCNTLTNNTSENPMPEISSEEN